jgi:hypothetical protein
MHATLFEYFQNRHLNAIDESFKRQGRRTPARYDQNRVGGNMGGPAIPEKLFYFANFEYNPIGQAATNAGTVNVPTEEGFRLLDSIPGLNKTNLGQFKKYVPPAQQASSRFASVGGIQVPLGPLSVAAPSYENHMNFVGSLDANLRSRDQLRGRYLHRRSGSIDTNSNLPAFFSPYDIRVHLASLAHFHTFSPSLTNELRAAYTRYFNDYRVRQHSYPNLDAFPNLTFRELGLNIGPFFVLPQSDRSNTYQPEFPFWLPDRDQYTPIPPSCDPPWSVLVLREPSSSPRGAVLTGRKIRNPGNSALSAPATNTSPTLTSVVA